MRLKPKDIAPYRTEQLAKQDCLCALCNEPIDGDAVLDHDHKSGLIRKVLHRGCNALLGHLENNMPRNKISVERLEKWSRNLIEYITTVHSDVHHPTYRTPEEKIQRAQARRKKMQAYKKKGGGRPPKR